MSVSGQIAIAGVHEHPTRWAPEKTDSQIMAESARGALEDCGLGLGDVDGLFAAGIGMGPMGLVNLAEYMNLKPRYLRLLLCCSCQSRRGGDSRWFL